MKNLACQLEFTFAGDLTRTAPRKDLAHADLCFACGDKLFSPDTESCSWQSWDVYLKILGMREVELLCGYRGANLQDFLPLAQAA
jgi:hypothetical protein